MIEAFEPGTSRSCSTYFRVQLSSTLQKTPSQPLQTSTQAVAQPTEPHVMANPSPSGQHSVQPPASPSVTAPPLHTSLTVSPELTTEPVHSVSLRRLSFLL